MEDETQIYRELAKDLHREIIRLRKIKTRCLFCDEVYQPVEKVHSSNTDQEESLPVLW